MDYVKLGNTGMDVSQICLGCMSFGTAEGWVHNQWALDEEGSRTIIKRALELGTIAHDKSIKPQPYSSPC
jgi:aryl-alcohol dehydrogenase-like predicted oxidoreductase